MVTVSEVDVARKRISLTMKEGGEKPDPDSSRDRSRRSEERSQKPVNKKPELLNPFQAKLMELKKNFKD